MRVFTTDIMTEPLLSSYEQMLLYRDELGIEGTISPEEAAEELISSHAWMRDQLGLSIMYLDTLEELGVITSESDDDCIPDIDNLITIANTFRLQRDAMYKAIKRHKLEYEYSENLKEITKPKIYNDILLA